MDITWACNEERVGRLCVCVCVYVCVYVCRKKTFLAFRLNMFNKRRILTAVHSHATRRLRLTAYWKSGDYCAPCLRAMLSEE